MSIADQTHYPPRIESELGSGQNLAEVGESPLKVLWRYKFFVLLLLGCGLGYGYWRGQQKPTTYGAGTQLMIKSDRPLSLDTNTGTVVGGVPNSDILSALITSDPIIQVASIDPEMTSLASMQNRAPSAIGGIIRSGIRFSARDGAQGSSDRMIAALSYDGTDPDICVAAVNSTMRAIQKYFDEERKSSATQLAELINEAEKKLLPQVTQLEAQYREFRSKTPLEWGADGKVINPHRERQASLQVQYVQAEQDLRRKNSNRKLIQSSWEANQDAVLVSYLISQLGSGGTMNQIVNDDFIKSPNFSESDKISVPELRDLELEQLTVEQSLVPLLVQQQQLVVELGPNHPAVRNLDSQVATTRKALNELSRKRQQRVEEIKKTRQEQALTIAETNDLSGGGNEQAVRYVNTYLVGVQGQMSLISEQMMELEAMIQTEKEAAAALTNAEKEDEMYRRQISRIEGMLTRLEEQMARLDISTVNRGIVVQPLLGSVSARVTGPDTKQDLIMFGMGGFALAALLCYLFDASARIYRSSEQIEAALGVPIITHVPLDDTPSKPRKLRGKDPISQLDPKLSVVHRPLSSVSEAISCIRTAIFFHSSKSGNKVYQVTSPLPGDGKSTLAANIATSLALAGKKVLLIDLDLRSPRLTARFNLNDKDGVTNLLNGDCDPLMAIHQTPIANLDVLPSGKIPANPAEALSLPEMREAFDWFRERYDFVIVDTPPLLLVTDPAIVTSYVDSTLLVMRIVRSCKPNSKEAMSILRQAEANVMGVLVNKVDEVSVGSYYQVGGYGSYGSIGYGYGRRYREERKKAGSSDPYVVKGRVHREQLESAVSPDAETATAGSMSGQAQA